MQGRYLQKRNYHDIVWYVTKSEIFSPNAGVEVGESPEVNHSMLWRNPSQLIRVRKQMFEAEGKSLAERLEECPLPIRIRVPITLSTAQVADIGLRDTKTIAYVEKNAEFKMVVYGDRTTGEEHVAVIKGIGNGESVPLRIHSSCLTAETFHASNCDCQEQLEMALAIADKEDCGGVIWLRQEGRGNGLAAKAKQLKIMLGEEVDTIEAFERAGYPGDQRDYSIAVDILRDLGVKSVRLITNNPSKMRQLKQLGIVIIDRIPCEVPPINDVVKKDLMAKRDKLGHLFDRKNGA